MRWLLGLVCMFVMMNAFAQYVPAPLPEEASLEQMFSAIVALFANFKALSLQMKVAAVIFLLIASMKNSFLKPLWDKAGDAKVIAAPILSLAAFLVMMPELNVNVIIAAVTTGAASAYLADVLDLLKKIPGIGPMYVAVIDFIGNVLRRPKA